MTQLNITLTAPTQDGTLVPAAGLLRFTPTQRRTVEDVTVLPLPFQTHLTLGVAVVDLAPNDLNWAWRIDEHVQGTTGRTIFVNIPSVGPVSYTDLIPLDPTSLAPAPGTNPAWAAPIAELTERLDAGTVTPDPDNPGFYLIGA